MANNNRELSQFGALVTVADSSKNITFGSTVTGSKFDSPKIAGVGTWTSPAGLGTVYFHTDGGQLVGDELLTLQGTRYAQGDSGQGSFYSVFDKYGNLGIGVSQSRPLIGYGGGNYMRPTVSIANTGFLIWETAPEGTVRTAAGIVTGTTLTHWLDDNFYFDNRAGGNIIFRCADHDPEEVGILTSRHLFIEGMDGEIDFGGAFSRGGTVAYRSASDRTGIQVAIAPRYNKVGLAVTGTSTRELLRLTQKGIGDVLVVEDETPDSSPFVINRNGTLIKGTETSVAVNDFDHGLQMHSNEQTNGATISLLRSNYDSAGPILSFAKGRGDVRAGINTAAVFQDNLGGIAFLADDGTDYGSVAASIAAIVDGPVGVNSTPGRIEFRTTTNGSASPQMRMMIDKDGQVGINTAQPASEFTVRGTITYVGRPSAASVTTIGVDGSGTIREATSSRRFKENITAYDKGLETVSALNPVTFNYIGEEKTVAGLVAEEVAEAGLDEFVNFDEENLPKSLNYGNMVTVLINAVQELKAENDALKARVEALEAK